MSELKLGDRCVLIVDAVVVKGAGNQLRAKPTEGIFENGWVYPIDTALSLKEAASFSRKVRRGTR